MDEIESRKEIEDSKLRLEEEIKQIKRHRQQLEQENLEMRAQIQSLTSKGTTTKKLEEDIVKLRTAVTDETKYR